MGKAFDVVRCKAVCPVQTSSPDSTASIADNLGLDTETRPRFERWENP
jgi:hypothetical protein